jgi:predicted PurR-regulated permease PerM
MADDGETKNRVISYSIDIYITLGLISLFAYFSLQILSPFISVLLWAIILAVAIHPVFEKIKAAIGGRDGLAATIICLFGLVFLLVPAFFAVQSIIETFGEWARVLKGGTFAVPPPSDAVKDWPLIGGRVHALWTDAATNLGATLKHFAPQLEAAGLKMLSAGAGLLGGVLQFALSIIFAAVFLCYSAPLAGGTKNVAHRISTARGRALVEMAGATIRNVSRGILGVAVIQGGLAAIGILVAGLPFAGLLAAAVVASCIVQVPILVIVPTIIYVWSAEPTTFALIYTVYMVPVLLSDNVLKPVLMARGLETPMAVILIGVIGGTVSNGLMGLFIGPVVLALFYKMVTNWMSAALQEGEDAKAPSGSA